MVTVTSQIQLVDARTHGRKFEICSEHALESLNQSRQATFFAADLLFERGMEMPRVLVKSLLLIIEELEHELTHAGWGGLECDQQQRYGPHRRVSPVALPPAPADVKPEAKPEPAFIYRFFDKCGCLLYVGITNDFEVRRAAHAKDSPWHALAETHTVQEMPSRADAAAAELRAIDTESPAFNSAGRTSRATAEQVTAYLVTHATAS